MPMNSRSSVRWREEKNFNSKKNIYFSLKCKVQNAKCKVKGRFAPNIKFHFALTTLNFELSEKFYHIIILFHTGVFHFFTLPKNGKLITLIYPLKIVDKFRAVFHIYQDFQEFYHFSTPPTATTII